MAHGGKERRAAALADREGALGHLQGFFEGFLLGEVTQQHHDLRLAGASGLDIEQQPACVGVLGQALHLHEAATVMALDGVEQRFVDAVLLGMVDKVDPVMPGAFAAA